MSHALRLLPLLTSVLLAQEVPTVTARVGLGGYVDTFSDATGTRNGTFLNASWFHDRSGPWSLSLLRSERTEGVGTLVTVGKEQAFGESSWAWLGLSKGSSADFLPQYRADLDTHFVSRSGWGIGAELAWSRYADRSTMLLLQAGPSWEHGEWSASARIQQLQYSDGGGSDTGLLLDLRWGAHNLSRWHSLRMAAGSGILDAWQPGGTHNGTPMDSSMATTGGWASRGGRRGPGSSGLSSPEERLVAVTTHLPFNTRLALQGELSWGQRDDQFTTRGVSLQLLWTW